MMSWRHEDERKAGERRDPDGDLADGGRYAAKEHQSWVAATSVGCRWEREADREVLSYSLTDRRAALRTSRAALITRATSRPMYRMALCVYLDSGCA